MAGLLAGPLWLLDGTAPPHRRKARGAGKRLP